MIYHFKKIGGLTFRPSSEPSAPNFGCIHFSNYTQVNIVPLFCFLFSDVDFLFQLSIHHFDRSSLCKVQTRDHSHPMVKEERGYEGDVSSEDEEQVASTTSYATRAHVHPHKCFQESSEKWP